VGLIGWVALVLVLVGGWVVYVVWDTRATARRRPFRGKKSPDTSVASIASSTYNIGHSRGDSWWWWRRPNG
jgi:hypothetical protein